MTIILKFSQLKRVNKMFLTTDIDKLNDKLHCLFSDKFDLFICYNSFEDRCVSIASNISIDFFRTALIITDKEPLENEEENLNKLSDIFRDKKRIARVDLSFPLTVADRIMEELVLINSSVPLNKVFIDITTFTHETLLMLFAIFREKFHDAEIVCGYINAQEYSVDEEHPQIKWLSRGIGDVRSVLGYSGSLQPSKENHLIVIMGYEYERAARIIDAIDPDCLSIGYNTEKTSTADRDRDASAGYANLVKILAAYYEQTSDFEVPCNNPYEAYIAICKKIEEIGENVNIMLAPMSNKISTVGAALAALENRNVQICYAPALAYNTTAYSLAGNTCYIFSFDYPKNSD